MGNATTGERETEPKVFLDLQGNKGLEYDFVLFELKDRLVDLDQGYRRYRELISQEGSEGDLERLVETLAPKKDHVEGLFRTILIKFRAQGKKSFDELYKYINELEDLVRVGQSYIGLTEGISEQRLQIYQGVKGFIKTLERAQIWLEEQATSRRQRAIEAPAQIPVSSANPSGQEADTELDPAYIKPIPLANPHPGSQPGWSGGQSGAKPGRMVQDEYDLGTIIVTAKGVLKKSYEIKYQKDTGPFMLVHNRKYIQFYNDRELEKPARTYNFRERQFNKEDEFWEALKKDIASRFQEQLKKGPLTFELFASGSNDSFVVEYRQKR